MIKVRIEAVPVTVDTRSSIEYWQNMVLAAFQTNKPNAQIINAQLVDLYDGAQTGMHDWTLNIVYREPEAAKPDQA